MSGPAGGAKEFYLTIVRHGQTVANVNKVIQGHSNTPLTELGREQASALAAYFYSHGPRQFHRVYSSDLGRAQHTCQLVLEQLERLLQQSAATHERPPLKHSILLSEQLRERRYGTYFEGKPIVMLQAEAFKLGYDATSFTHYTPPEAESMEQVSNRVSSFCNDTLWRQPQHQEEVLIVSHWATIKEFLKLFQPLVLANHTYQPITSDHLTETPNLAFSRFKIRRTESPFYKSAQPKIDVQVISIHQTVHLRADQISVNLRQVLC